jgi:hypothetical protein
MHFELAAFQVTLLRAGGVGLSELLTLSSGIHFKKWQVPGTGNQD